MIIYKCDVCGGQTEDDIIPSDWSILQVNGPQGSETQNLHAKHLCGAHSLDKLVEASRK